MYVHPVAIFLVPDWGDNVDSGTRLSYRSARPRVHRLAGRGMTTLCRSQLYPPFRAINLATGISNKYLK
jgi:hypothetical protein